MLSRDKSHSMILPLFFAPCHENSMFQIEAAPSAQIPKWRTFETDSQLTCSQNQKNMMSEK